MVGWFARRPLRGSLCSLYDRACRPKCCCDWRAEWRRAVGGSPFLSLPAGLQDAIIARAVLSALNGSRHERGGGAGHSRDLAPRLAQIGRLLRRRRHTDNVRANAGGRRRKHAKSGCSLYPRVDPVAIVLCISHDGERILLGRQSSYPRGMFTCVSGFVEHGEAAERAAAREVFEETGVIVSSAELVASQPWPCGRGSSCELMLAVVCRAAVGGEAIDVLGSAARGGGGSSKAAVGGSSSSSVNSCSASAGSSANAARGELEAARWFGRAAVVQMLAAKGGGGKEFVPPAFAIAHSLISRWSSGVLAPPPLLSSGRRATTASCAALRTDHTSRSGAMSGAVAVAHAAAQEAAVQLLTAQAAAQAAEAAARAAAEQLVLAVQAEADGADGAVAAGGSVAVVAGGGSGAGGTACMSGGPIPRAGLDFVGRWRHLRSDGYGVFLSECVGLSWAVRKVGERIHPTPVFHLTNGQLMCETVCLGAETVHETVMPGRSMISEPNLGIEYEVEGRWEADVFVASRTNPTMNGGRPIVKRLYIDRATGELHIDTSWGGSANFYACFARASDEDLGSSLYSCKVSTT